MERKQGSKHTKVMTNLGAMSIVRWDLQPVVNEAGETVGMSYYEERMIGKPTVKRVKEVVLKGMNAVIEEQIFKGFVWEGIPVWLSSENQFNYKAAFDLAMQTGGDNLPVKFKFGTDEEPVYHTFETIDELMKFYTEAMTYISNCLNEGWAKKDAVDWSAYEEIINNAKSMNIKEVLKNGGMKELTKMLNSGEFADLKSQFGGMNTLLTKSK